MYPICRSLLHQLYIIGITAGKTKLVKATVHAELSLSSLHMHLFNEPGRLFQQHGQIKQNKIHSQWHLFIGEIQTIHLYTYIICGIAAAAASANCWDFGFHIGTAFSYWHGFF